MARSRYGDNYLFSHLELFISKPLFAFNLINMYINVYIKVKDKRCKKSQGVALSLRLRQQKKNKNKRFSSQYLISVVLDLSAAYVSVLMI